MKYKCRFFTFLRQALSASLTYVRCWNYTPHIVHCPRPIFQKDSISFRKNSSLPKKNGKVCDTFTSIQKRESGENRNGKD